MYVSIIIPEATTRKTVRDAIVKNRSQAKKTLNYSKEGKERGTKNENQREKTENR